MKNRVFNSLVKNKRLFFNNQTQSTLSREGLTNETVDRIRAFVTMLYIGQIVHLTLIWLVLYVWNENVVQLPDTYLVWEV